MESITVYLEGVLEGEFVRDEYTDVVRSLYKLLVGMFRFEADTFTIARTHLAFSKDGVPIDSLDFARLELASDEFNSERTRMETIFREGMKILLDRDGRLRQHVQLVEDTQEYIVYRLTADPQPRPDTASRRPNGD